MKNNFFKSATLVVIVVFMLVGCGGGGAKVKTTNTSTTMGQELMDLDASYKQGLITDKEYNQAKKTILNRYK